MSSQEVPSVEKTLYTCSDFDMFTLETTKPLLSLSVLYRTPKSDMGHFMNHISDLFRKISLSKSNAIVLGDFNINTSDRIYHKLEETAQQYGFRDCVVTPTHISGSSIDHIFTNIADGDYHSGTTPVYYSDHRATWIAMKL